MVIAAMLAMFLSAANLMIFASFAGATTGGCHPAKAERTHHFLAGLRR